MKKDIKRAVIEMTVDRGLREINEDPRRSIRKLADYGKQFGKGRFMQEIHAHYQDLLRNDESPYYSAIELVLKHTEMRALKDFGINLGYNAITKGGKLIRKAIEKNGHMIPWNIFFSLDADSSLSFSPQELSPVITQCRKTGIFCFVIELKKDLTYFESLVSLFKMYDDCAFMFIIPDMEITEEDAEKLSKATNVLSFVNASGEYNYSNTHLFKSHRMWYGTYDTYDENTFTEMDVEEKIKDNIDLESAFVLLLAREGTSSECILKVTGEVKETRLEPKYPLFTFDLYGDSMKISELISERRCFVHIKENGIVHTNIKDIPFSRGSFDLEETLQASLLI